MLLRFRPLAFGLVACLCASGANGQAKDQAPASGPSQPHSAPPAATLANETSTAVLSITAKGSGIPVGKAEIKLGSTVVLSDNDGVAKIQVPMTGDGTVQVRHKGFTTLELNFADLRPAGNLAVRLYPGTPDDDVIIVQGRRKDSAVSRTTISAEEAAKVAPGGDVAQVIKLLPGVQTSGNNGRQIIIQGSGPRDSRYFIDDLETPFIFHNFGNLSVIPSEFLESVEFESAGFGAEYGDATGGIITLRTKTVIPERPKTIVTLNVPFYSGVSHTRPLSEDSALTVGVRRSYIDVFLRQFLSRRNSKRGDTSGNLTIAPYFSDGEVAYLKKDTDGFTKTSLIAAVDGIKAAFPSSQAANENGQASFGQSTSFVDLGVERNQRLDKDWSYDTTPQIYYYRNSTEFNTYSAINETEKIRIPTHLTRRLDKSDKFYLGVDPDFTIARTDVFAPRMQRSDPTYDPENAQPEKSNDYEHYANLAAWVAIDQSIGALTVTPGVRAYYNGEIKRSSADPRLRARYVLSDDHSLKAAVGQYSEGPQPLEASPSRGNSHLNFTRAMHYMVGIESKWGDDWSTDVSVYYKTIKDVVESDAVTNYNNEGKRRSRGFETLIRRNLTGRLFGWLAYTYSKTEEQRSQGVDWGQARYDQTNVVALVGDYKLNGVWDVGGRYDYHTGATHNLIDAAVFNSNLDKYEPRPTANGVNGGRLPAYNSATVYFNHDILYDEWKLALRFGMEQFWVRPQVVQVAYNYNYTKAQPVSSLSSVPFLELKGEF